MKNCVAIVTGASQGIGRSTAIRLARDFSAVVLAARNAKKLAEVATEVQKMGAEPLTLALDLSQVEASNLVVNTTLERFGQIDALLNIAGAVPQIDLFEMTDEQWKAGMEFDRPRLECRKASQPRVQGREGPSASEWGVLAFTL